MDYRGPFLGASGAPWGASELEGSPVEGTPAHHMYRYWTPPIQIVIMHQSPGTYLLIIEDLTTLLFLDSIWGISKGAGGGAHAFEERSLLGGLET